ncbi:MAG: PIN domain-containing protein [Thaumarchaeota archaeon]|nr:PIN domain-containing protein [Nitrososphaerota archaeon]
MVRTIDTRFLLAHFLADSEELKSKTRSKMLEFRQESAIIPTVVLHELYKLEFQKFGRETADTQLKSIETSGLKIEDLTSEIARIAAVLRCKYNDLPLANSIIAATSIVKGSKIVCSDDELFAKVKEIKMEWL